MALTGTGLKNAIKAIPGIIITDDTELQSFCDALINYLTTNAVISPGTFSNSGGPVTGAGQLS